MRRLPRGVAPLVLLSAGLLLQACSGGGGGEVMADEPGSSAQPVPSALDATQPPSGNFDLSHWYLTLPSGEMIRTAELNSGFQSADVFFTDPHGGGMVFRCPNIAGTTPDSHFSRTELREMLAPHGPASADENNWTTDIGGTLRATLRVDRVSTTGDDDKVGRIIIGQIHGEGAEVIRLYYRKRPGEPRGRIYAGLDTADNAETTWSPDIIGNSGAGGIGLGEAFSYEITLAGLTLTVRVVAPSGDGATYVAGIDPGYQGMKLYFKAGVYNQNNGGDPADYAQATFFALEREH